MTNLLTTAEAKALTEVKALYNKLTTEAKSAFAEEVSWAEKHYAISMVVVFLIALSLGHWVL